LGQLTVIWDLHRSDRIWN